LGVRDIDAYLQQRCQGWRRQTIEGYTVCLRSFLRYLHGSGRTALDLSSTVIGPRIYDDEQIPSALRPEEVQTVVEAARQDCSTIGRRDYALLMLLAAYGLRAGEIVALRLEDIDWQKEILRVRHSKTGAVSELLDVNESMLLRFDRSLQRRAELAGKPLNQLIEVWAQSDPSPNRLCEAKRVDN
jgi:integrase/recombinase XerD